MALRNPLKKRPAAVPAVPAVAAPPEARHLDSPERWRRQAALDKLTPQLRRHLGEVRAATEALDRAMRAVQAVADEACALGAQGLAGGLHPPELRRAVEQALAWWSQVPPGRGVAAVALVLPPLPAEVALAELAARRADCDRQIARLRAQAETYREYVGSVHGTRQSVPEPVWQRFVGEVNERIEDLRRTQARVDAELPAAAARLPEHAGALRSMAEIV